MANTRWVNKETINVYVITN